ncbi:MAG: hypothetical protein R6V67_10220 [Spirochaetia bacterium]
MVHNRISIPASFSRIVETMEELLHGEVAGISRSLIEEKLKGIFEMRKFFTHLELSWSQILVWFRMTGNVDRFTGGYRPAYIWM